MNSQWNTELVYRLIDLYHDRPILWNTSSKEYKDRDKKNTAWDEIAQTLNIQREIVERKMRILIFQFRRELVKPKVASGYISKWFAFEKMLFLKEKWGKLTTSTDAKQRDISNVVDFENVDTYIPTVSTSIKKVRPAQAKDDKSEETPKKMRRTRVDASMRDEFTIFGEYVATKLRNLCNSHASSTAQYHINNILYNAVIGKYNGLNRSPEGTSRETIVKDENVEEEITFKEFEDNVSELSSES